jgi:hypothetical protein
MQKGRNNDARGDKKKAEKQNKKQGCEVLIGAL